MIKYLQLQNFQSHRNTQLEFSPGVNVIIGESNHGKTAIMRALYWLIFGKPSGTTMLRHNTTADCVVTLETDDCTVSRIRGQSKNQYILNDEIYKGFGQTVPEPVVNTLNINEINFMRQMDPPFLFSKSAGEVAQYLNRLINLDVIDTSLLNIKRMLASAENSTISHHTEIRRLEKQLATFDWIEQAEIDIKKYEQHEKRWLRSTSVAKDLDIILDEYWQYKDTSNKLRHVPDLVKRVGIMAQRYETIKLDKKQYITVKNTVLYAQKAQTTLHTLPAINGAEKALQALEHMCKKLEVQQIAYSTLVEALKIYDKCVDVLKKAIANHKYSVAQLNKAMPEICPLCEQEIK